ncbi:MAG: ATP-binding protein [Candidatus Dormibacteraceae bacterium]
MAPQIVRGTESAPTPTVRGRDAELTVLGQHLDRLLSGVGTVVLVEGGAGMGKSRLLGDVVAMARRLSIGVGTGVADPGDSVVQLSVLMEALFEGSAPILERTALGDTHASPEQRYWLLQDLESLLEGAALKVPVLVCLDDVQWADSGTAAALRALPSRLATVPIGWVIALRPGQGSPQVRSAVDFLEGQGAAKITLGPLDQDGVAQMVADVLGAGPDGELLKMAERSAGSPFLLVELLSGLRDEGLVRVESGRAKLVELRLPQRVSQSMRLRLERMSGLARQLIAVAAALGRRFSLDDVAAMLNLSPSELLTPVDELIHSLHAVTPQFCLGRPHPGLLKIGTPITAAGSPEHAPTAHTSAVPASHPGSTELPAPGVPQGGWLMARGSLTQSRSRLTMPPPQWRQRCADT